MLPTTLVLVLSAAAAVQEETPDARKILQSAADAAQYVFSGSYEGTVETRSGSRRRGVAGTVRFVQFDYSHPLGGRLAIEGTIDRPGVEQRERFEATYDGDVVRRYLEGAHVVLEAEPGYGGMELLRGSFSALMVREFVATEPFTAELSAPVIEYVGTEPVTGTECHVVDAKWPNAAVRWYLGVEDYLPRRRERMFRSASGRPVNEQMTLEGLRVNEPIASSEFTLTPPEGVKVETMGTAPPAPLDVGDEVPAWTLTDGEGRTHALSDYRGQVVVLDFWASWCPHCRRAMPAMQELHDTFSDRGVAVFGVNCRERGRVDPVEFVRNQGFTYPVLVDGNSIAPKYRVMGIPAFYVIGPDGRLLYKRSGFNEQAEAELKSLLQRHAGG